jgi:hypothetical protein
MRMLFDYSFKLTPKISGIIYPLILVLQYHVGQILILSQMVKIFIFKGNVKYLPTKFHDDLKYQT